MDFNQEKYKKEILDALEDIRKALEEKEITVNGILKVSDVAGYIDEIGGGMVNATIKVKFGNAMFAGPDEVTNVTITPPSGNSYNWSGWEVQTGGWGNFSFTIQAKEKGVWSFTSNSTKYDGIGKATVDVQESKEYEVNLFESSGPSSPTNPEQPGIESLPVGEVKVEV